MFAGIDNMSYNVCMQKSVFGLSLVFILASWMFGVVPVRADVQFKQDGMFKARNVTTGQTAWSDSIRAKNLDELEFQVNIENIGTSESSDVHVRTGFALDPGSTLENRIFVGMWSATSVIGTVDIQVDSEATQKIVYVPGKAFKYGLGCDGCVVSDSIAGAGGTYVGKIPAGGKLEVRFRGQITNRQVAYVKPTSSPTPTPKVSANLTGSSSGGNSGVTGGVGGAAVAGTTPKTGFTDPIWVRTMIWLALGGAGIGLRQMARKMSKIEA
jgi:hypothetical protein